MSPPKGGAKGREAAPEPKKDEVEQETDQALQAAREKMIKERFGQSDANRVGGTRSARRKKIVANRPAITDDKKLQMTLKKMNLAPIPGIEEVMMYKDDNSVLQFNNPKVQAAPASNTYVINGTPETKELDQVLSRMMSPHAHITPEVIQQLKAAVNLENAAKNAVAPSPPAATSSGRAEAKANSGGASKGSSAKTPAGESKSGAQSKVASKAEKSSEEGDVDSDGDSDDVPETFEMGKAD